MGEEMKINKEVYQKLKEAIADANSIDLVKKHKEFLLSDKRVKDLNTRLAWDVFYSIKPEIRIPLVDEIYKTCNDNHLNTALKRIVNELNY